MLYCRVQCGSVSVYMFYIVDYIVVVLVSTCRRSDSRLIVLPQINEFLVLDLTAGVGVLRACISVVGHQTSVVP